MQSLSTVVETSSPRSAGDLEQEIIERRRIEEALRASEQRTRLILETANSSYVAIDSRGRIIDWNRQAEVTFGWSREEVLGRSLAETIIPPQYRAKHRRGLHHYLATGEAPVFNRRIELSALRRNGEEFPIELTIWPLKVGEVCSFNAFISDITERKQAELVLTEQAHELTRSNAELQRFAYVASHDLQEPLRMITSYVQLLARRYRGKLDSDADEFIGYAVEGVARMQALINDLLEYSRVGSQGKALRVVDASKVFDLTLRNLRVAVTESNATVTCDPLPTVKADAGQLTQLFQNLLGNAIKFHGEADPRIHVTAERADKEWRFSVRDNGIGFDPKFANRIFQVFQRLHRPGAYPGTGIGLAICQKIVERHGGRIWAESTPGEGSVFYFTLLAAEQGEST
jgi:PAS domain S-box-containing protein